MKQRCSWETVFFNAQNLVVGKTQARYVVTALIPDERVSDLPGMHYEHVEALHATAKARQDMDGEDVPKLYKQRVA